MRELLYLAQSCFSFLVSLVHLQPSRNVILCLLFSIYHFYINQVRWKYCIVKSVYQLFHSETKQVWILLVRYMKCAVGESELQKKHLNLSKSRQFDAIKYSGEKYLNVSVAVQKAQMSHGGGNRVCNHWRLTVGLHR